MATMHSISSKHFLKPSVCISGGLSPALKTLSFVTQLSNCITELQLLHSIAKIIRNDIAKVEFSTEHYPTLADASLIHS
jgi:hypothetical protein